MNEAALGDNSAYFKRANSNSYFSGLQQSNIRKLVYHPSQHPKPPWSLDTYHSSHPVEGGTCFCLYFCPYLPALLPAPAYAKPGAQKPSSVNSSLSKKNPTSKQTSIQPVLKMAISTLWELVVFFFLPWGKDTLVCFFANSPNLIPSYPSKGRLLFLKYHRTSPGTTTDLPRPIICFLTFGHRMPFLKEHLYNLRTSRDSFSRPYAKSFPKMYLCYFHASQSTTAFQQNWYNFSLT